MRDYCKVIKLYPFFLFLTASVLLFSSCGSSDRAQENSNANSTNTRPTTSGANVTPLTSPTPASTAQPSPSPSVAKPSPSPSPSKTDGLNVRYFNAKGVVTKINMELGSVELDHENIPGLMPAMIMEFYVKDKQMLVPLKVGDKVNFTIEDKSGAEVITVIKKQ